MAKLYRQPALEATTGAISWTIWQADDFDVKRITLKFASAPSAIENINITIVSKLGTAFNTRIRSYDPNGLTDISMECIDGIMDGDKILLEYANTDSISVTGTATLEL